MIHFGTDGWRAVIADDFTFENVRRVASALGRYLADLGESRPVAIGFDTRFLSAEFAEAAAGALADWGCEILLSDRAIPTPCLSHSVCRMGLSCGVMITASHNPPRYNGVKIKAPYGGTALPGFIAGLTVRLQCDAAPERPVRRPGRVVSSDFVQPYLDSLGKQANLSCIRDLPGQLIFDPMHGAARGLLARLLGDGRLQVQEMRGEENPGFGGSSPEPVERNLGALTEAVRESRGALGLATDGDGDRLGAVDDEGRWVSPHRVFAVLLRHLVPKAVGNQGRRVVKTFSTSEMINKLALARGLEVIETEIGFKNIVPHILSGGVLMAGEESGGFCFEGYIPERDGLLSALKLLEAVAVSGRPLSQLVADVFDEVGPHCYGRTDYPARDNPGFILQWIRDNSPEELAGLEVNGIEARDGVKMRLVDGSWLLMRASGTEPLVRFYAESSSETGVQDLLEAAGHLWADGVNTQAGAVPPGG